MHSPFLKGLAAAATLVLPSAAHAAVLSWTGEPGSVTLAPGQTTTVSLFLNESGPDPRIDDEDGLLSVGYKVTRTSGDAIISGFVPNAVTFSLVADNSFATTGAQFYGEIPFTATSGPSPDGSGNIPIGTLSLTGGLTGSTFTLGDYGAGNQTVTYSGTGSLDSLIQTGSIVVAVPEPATLGLAALALPLLARRRR